LGGNAPPATPAVKGGGSDGVNTSASDGGANLGGGAGGARDTPGSGGGNGGSGVLILAYPTIYSNLVVSGGLTFSLDFVNRANYKVYKFTAGTGTVSYPGGMG
jgi:hypothetical protein